MRLACLLLLFAACDAPQPRSTEVRASPAPVAEPVVKPREAIDAVLDGWHRAAATADFEGYFGRMTPDAVFIGTDATERWDRPAFEAFARPHFEGDEAWTYRSVERHVDVKDGVAWFDERLVNEKYGETRGSGVLVRDHHGAWKIRQYVLSFPIPNAVAGEVVERIQSLP